MIDLMRYAASLEGVALGAPPPVENWNPPLSGSIDIRIDGDGRWFHEGAPITRSRLVRLFSTILKREGEQYFLVTPVEKYRIEVADTPFVGVRLDIEEPGGDQHIAIRTNVGDEVLVGPNHALEFRLTPGGDGAERAPYVHVRCGLEARLVRSAYFDLVEVGEVREVEGVSMFGVMSAGVFFPMAPASEIVGDETNS
jgi:hypothetical protein